MNPKKHTSHTDSGNKIKKNQNTHSQETSCDPSLETTTPLRM